MPQNDNNIKAVSQLHWRGRPTRNRVF